jgi:hypothetical protein
MSCLLLARSIRGIAVDTFRLWIVSVISTVSAGSGGVGAGIAVSVGIVVLTLLTESAGVIVADVLGRDPLDGLFVY